MTKTDKMLRIGLQFFGEGAGDGGTGDGAESAGNTAENGGFATTADKSVVGNDNNDNGANAQTTDAQTTDDKEDRVKKFESLIKGEYKDLYDARVADTVQKRFKGTQKTLDKYNALQPGLAKLASKYGVDPNDTDALMRAIDADDSAYEKEALERGVPVEQIKAEKELALLRREKAEAEAKTKADAIYADWMRQANDLKAKFPNFDINEEIKNTEFMNLLNAGIPVESAYFVAHKDEILTSAMQTSTRKSEERVTNRVLANRARPNENGTSGQAASVSTVDVSKLTNEQMDEYLARAARGETITFRDGKF